MLLNYFILPQILYFLGGYRVYLMVKLIMGERGRKQEGGEKWGGSNNSSVYGQRDHIFLLTLGFIFNLRTPFLDIFV